MDSIEQNRLGELTIFINDDEMCLRSSPARVSGECEGVREWVSSVVMMIVRRFGHERQQNERNVTVEMI